MDSVFPTPRIDPKEAQVQRLAQKTGCDPALCREALVESQGSLLSALLLLEEKALVSPPDHPNGGFYSTKSMGQATEPAPMSDDLDWEGQGFWGSLQHEILHNQFEIWRGTQRLWKIPVTLLVLLFPLTYGSLVVLLILPLFFGIHYRFSSEGSFLSEFNPIVKRISNSLSNFRHLFKHK